MQRERRNLDHASLLATARNAFNNVPEPFVDYNGKYPITDCLMSAVAMFGLKYPSLLQYDKDVHGDALLEHNLKKLYQIKNIPSDTHFRERLDNVDYTKLDAVIDALIVPLQRGKILESYKFLNDYYLVSIDGTGCFSSNDIHCVNCCMKHAKSKCSIDISWNTTEREHNKSLHKWMTSKSGKKDAVLLIYSPVDNKWWMHICDKTNNSNGTTHYTKHNINNNILIYLSQIDQKKILPEITSEIVQLIIEDTSLFNGRDQTGAGTTYYHQLLNAVMVHPDKKETFPLAIEPIIKQDGLTKNDCEHNAALRLLRKLKKSHPHLKLIVVLDALYAKAPLIKLLQELDFRYIITAKGTDFLFKQHYNNKEQIQITKTLDNIEQSYAYSLNIPLNASNTDIKVNLVEYTEIEPKYNKKKEQPEENKFYSSWLTDIPITSDVLDIFMKGARSRWKIENEVHNTLKNQGYNLDHNYGHGDNNLSTVLCYTMFIAFLIDQIQFSVGYYFKKIMDILKSKKSLWEHIRSYFFNFEFNTWDDLYQSIFNRVEKRLTNRLARRGITLNTT